MTHPDETPNRLLPCPFCGSNDIDPEGVASIDEKFRADIYTWDKAKPEHIVNVPACNNCSASTFGDWNTRASISAPGTKEQNDDNYIMHEFFLAEVINGETVLKAKVMDMAMEIKRLRALSAQPADALPDHFRDATKMVLTDAVTVQEAMTTQTERAEALKEIKEMVDHSGFPYEGSICGGDGNMILPAETVKAIIAALTDPAIPDGMCLTPLKPTDEMVQAGVAAWRKNPLSVVVQHSAMIAVRPEGK